MRSENYLVCEISKMTNFWCPIIIHTWFSSMFKIGSHTLRHINICFYLFFFFLHSIVSVGVSVVNVSVTMVIGVIIGVSVGVRVSV